MQVHCHAGLHPLEIAVMPTTLEAESTLPERYQTTVPETVRRALRLGKRDKIHYAIWSTGEVVLTRAAAVGKDDPVLGQFLDFLVQDIAKYPERLQPIDMSLVQRGRELTAGIEIDLDAALSPQDEWPRLPNRSGEHARRPPGAHPWLDNLRASPGF
jgi:antitoxin PrlF